MNTQNQITLPASLDEWNMQRLEYRAQLWHLLGELPPIFTPEVKIVSTEQREGYTLERFQFENGAEAAVHGYLLLPSNVQGQVPAVLYQHMHGHKYALGKDDIFRENPASIQPGVALVKAGFAVIAVDTYAFGAREFDAPANNLQSGAETEQVLAKKFLWEGTSLWAMMVRDDILTLNYLLTRSEIDPKRIGTTGMSMGGSRATWLAALDERIAAAVPVAQMTRYRDFVTTGNLNMHSIYYFVPGVLKSNIDMEILTSLAAPRFQKILIGDSDPLSPIEGVRTIVDFTRQIYELYGAGEQFESVIYEGVGHMFTADMFREMLGGMQGRL